MIKRTFIINGVSRTVLVGENETLASFLRERLLLTGCKSAAARATAVHVTSLWTARLHAPA